MSDYLLGVITGAALVNGAWLYREIRFMRRLLKGSNDE